ncbi:MAG: hypothetical protein JWM68_4556, partial [Verrucomicrobiales bacterium]|nr:hypothetical protein [Verrucomicrobiales bacterium]
YARDGVTNSAAATVNIIIRPINDAPSFSVLQLYVVNEDSGLQTVPAFATEISPGAFNEANQQLSFVVSNSNPGLFLTQPALSREGTLTFTPTPNAFGTSIVSVVLLDNGGSLNGGKDSSLPKSFTLVVNPVNDPPAFAKGPNQFLNQNASSQNVVGWASNISPGPANESNQNISFIVTNDNPVLFTQAPQIDNNGTLTFAPSLGSFGIAHVSVIIKDNGGTGAGGEDESAVQEFLITINAPPVARIITPTNGSVFISSTPISILCDATDPDGTVTNLDLFRQDIFAANLTQSHLYTWSGATAGTYRFGATATDNAGLTGSAEPVNITVLAEPPLTVVVRIHLNPQTGLFEETVKIANPSSVAFGGVRVLVRGLTNGATVYNASGSSSGIPYLEYNHSIPAGQSVNLVIEYYVPSRVTPSRTLSAELVAPAPYLNPSGTPMQIDRAVRLADGSMLIDFMSASNRVYYIQYSSDLREWETAIPCVTGTGSRMQWIDNGPPKTDAWPSTRPFCAYRILQMP